VITHDYLVGVDVGTSGCKVAFFDLEFELLATSYREYLVHSSKPGWVQLDTDKVWKAICQTVKEAAKKLNLNNANCHIAFSTVGEGLICCDKSGYPLYPAILSSDVRSSKIANDIAEQCDEREIYRITGRFPHPMTVLPKILWVKENQKFVSKDVIFLDFQSWLLRRLGLDAVTDFSTAGGSMMFDIEKRQWSEKLLELALIKAEQLPHVAPAGTKIGCLNHSLKFDLGLQNCDHVYVYLGAMDQMCNALGSGAVRRGDSVCSIGTVMCTTIVLNDNTDIDTLRKLRVPRVESAIEGQYVTQIILWNGGGALRWFRDNLATNVKEKAQRLGKNAYEIMLGNESKRNTVFFLPHLTGSGTPWMDPKSRGAFIGLTLASDNRSMANAVLEGVIFDLKLSIERLRNAGLTIKELKAVGGGSRSPLWLQLIADILHLKVSKPVLNEAGCVGAAILSGWGAGFYANLEETSRKFVKFEERFVPTKKAEFYAEKYRLYKEIYPALKKLNHRICEMEAKD